jgi:hypothetical protein
MNFLTPKSTRPAENKKNLLLITLSTITILKRAE